METNNIGGIFLTTIFRNIFSKVVKRIQYTRVDKKKYGFPSHNNGFVVRLSRMYNI